LHTKKIAVFRAASASVVLSVGSLYAWAQAGIDPRAGKEPPVEQQAAATALTTPLMAGPLAANPNPMSFDAGAFGPVYVTGGVSGLSSWQNNTFPDDQPLSASLSNGQFFVQKVNGVFQYYAQIGAYTIPELGAPHFNVVQTTREFFGPVPMAFIKFAPNDEFSIQAGKLAGLIGVENNFSFQNVNIERGLLWSQEPFIGRGAQLNYTAGLLAMGFALNRGFYPNAFTWFSGSLTYTLGGADSSVSIAGSNHARATTGTAANRFYQNNETLFNVVYTYNSTPWTVTPYVQYTNVPVNPSIGAFTSASTFGEAILINYSFGEGSALTGFSLPLRLEYISSTGSLASGAPNLLYGPGSNAWSVTVTPTYQYKIFFARAELSHVGAGRITTGSAFGSNGSNTTQTRILFETGILF
jgi:Putative beta-barrel porin-2, OmpL-like. bbp2